MNVLFEKAIIRRSTGVIVWKFLKLEMKNVRFISIFDASSPLIFLRFSEVGLSPFRDFPGLIIIRKKGLLKFLASEIVTERGFAKR